MHIMLDLETLGKKPGCVVLSIGAKAFVPYGAPLGAPDTFYTKPDIFTQLMAGLDIDGETVDNFWRKQPEQTQREFTRSDPALAVANEFVSWFERLTVPPRQDEIYVWAKSPSFDCEILHKFLETFGCKVPWNFRRLMDVRTVIEVSGINEKEVPKSAGNIAHHSISDCEWQIAQVRAAYLAIKGPLAYPAQMPAPTVINNIVAKHANIDDRPLGARLGLKPGELSERNTLELDDAEREALRQSMEGA